MTGKSEYYINRIYSHCYSRRPIFGKWKMFIEFIHFLNNPNYLSLSIEKMILEQEEFKTQKGE